MFTTPLHFRSLLALLLVLLLSGCAPVSHIAGYDEVIDRGVTSLQSRTEDHLSRLEFALRKLELLPDDSPEIPALQEQLAYASSEEFYLTFRVELRVLKSRAGIHENNVLTLQQFDALEEILNLQETLHKGGLSDAEDIVDMRDAFTRAFQGILRLEIAKKRDR